MKTGISKVTERELRETRVETPDSIIQLLKVIFKMLKMKHDYGTTVYALSISATATFQYMARKLGVTGFQASCADMDILARTRGLKNGFKILDFKDLLYPQYIDKFELSYSKVLEDNIEHIGKQVKDNLLNNTDACKSVTDHWQMISDLHDKYVKDEAVDKAIDEITEELDKL